MAVPHVFFRRCASEATASDLSGAFWLRFNGKASAIGFEWKIRRWPLDLDCVGLGTVIPTQLRSFAFGVKLHIFDCRGVVASWSSDKRLAAS